jgi:anhydro-N-acetylmuramic acid kinase
MIYQVIGLMSGSSLDGLDICFVRFEEVRGSWSFEILASDCIAYTQTWKDNLKDAKNKSVADFLELNTAYGRYIGACINDFIQKNALEHKVHFIASHGHTIHHNTHEKTSFQLGDGASICALSQLPVITDLRSLDVALGGQGAPIVAIGDQLLFSEYQYWLNIGGIANVSFKNNEGKIQAFDICVANQALNYLSNLKGFEFDNDGEMAQTGNLLHQELEQLLQASFYSQPLPKSLSNEEAMQLVKAFISNENYSIEDRLHTTCHFIAKNIASSIQKLTPSNPGNMLVTGGGALNRFLVSLISKNLSEIKIIAEVPEMSIVQNKEALIMALIGTLRWREEINIDCNNTGAIRSSVSGALWMSN